MLEYRSVVRLHAAPGGFVTKGGHYFTAPAALRSSYRREYPHFDKASKRPSRVATIGVRLAIGGLVMPTRERLEALEQEWSTLPRAIIR